MSVLVKGMKMPKDCPMCPCAHWDKNILTGCELVWRYVPDSETAYWQSDKRPDWCPLVEVPTPHGRLIDADGIDRAFSDSRWEDGDWRTGKLKHWGDRPDWCLTGAEVERLITAAPTIIEAEEGE